MKITNLDIVKSEKRFAFLSINRSVKSNKALRESIVKKGVLNPLIIMNASDIDDDTILDQFIGPNQWLGNRFSGKWSFG